LLGVHYDGIHIFTASDGDCKIETTLCGTTEIDKTSLDTGEMTLERGNRLKEAIFILSLAVIIADIAKRIVDSFDLLIKFLATDLGFLGRFLG
jgi:hypothetical protein